MLRVADGMPAPERTPRARPRNAPSRRATATRKEAGGVDTAGPGNHARGDHAGGRLRTGIRQIVSDRFHS